MEPEFQAFGKHTNQALSNDLIHLSVKVFCLVGVHVLLMFLFMEIIGIISPLSGTIPLLEVHTPIAAFLTDGTNVVLHRVKHAIYQPINGEGAIATSGGSLPISLASPSTITAINCLSLVQIPSILMSLSQTHHLTQQPEL